MKLYYSPGACSLAADIVIHEANLPTTFIKVDLKTKLTENGDDYRAINAKGYVPALQLDDGDVLTENVAILSYLASLTPRFMPQDGMAKWHALETLAFVSTELHKSFKPIFNPAASEEQKTAAKALVAQRLGLLEQGLAERDFIVGDDFTVVDAYLFVMLLWAQKHGVSVPPSLTRYADTLRKRPSVSAALKMEGLSTGS